MKRLLGYALLAVSFGLRCVHHVLHPGDVAYWIEDKVVCKLLDHNWESCKDATKISAHDDLPALCWVYCKRCSERKDCDCDAE